MGAEHSANNKKKDDEQYERMLRYKLEQQRKIYEEKCKELLEAQQNKIQQHVEFQTRTNQNSTLLTQCQANASLYPNLQEAVFVQNSIPSSSYNASGSCGPSQNHNIMNHCLPSAPSAISEPTAQTAAETRVDTNSRLEPIIKIRMKYKCPTCKENRLEDQIFQCQKGHSSCKECKSKSVKCGVCNSNITSMRNIELEALMGQLQLKNNYNNNKKVKCPNHKDGCRTILMQGPAMDTHLKDCIFREMECPLSFICGCSWRGKINQIQVHFRDCHPIHGGANVGEEMSFDISTENHSVHHVSMGKFNFLVHIQLDINLQVMYLTVQHIGTQKNAGKWNYEFHIYNKSQPKRKYLYVDACITHNIPFSQLCREHTCAVVTLPHVMSFVKENKLTYKFYIKNQIQTSKLKSEAVKGRIGGIDEVEE